MILAAGLLCALAVVLVEPVSRWLAGAGWPTRAPRAALVLWQAVGLAAGLAAIGAGVVFAVAPLANSLPDGLAALWQGVTSGQPLRDLGVAQVVALLAAVLLGGRLLGVLLMDGARTLRHRRRHRQLVDLVGTPWTDAPGPVPGSAVVLDHPAAVAYCLPGRQSRVVVSAGTLSRLDRRELRAVLAHERAHITERHDLVVLPFGAWVAALPFVPGVRLASQAVASLVEMLADDRARTRCDRMSLATAIATVGAARTPAGSLAAGGSTVVARVERLVDPPTPASFVLLLGAYGAAAVLLAVPTLLLLLA